ncbi:MAG TPA: hypothetical protein VMW47_11185 [Verrucomicrobiae bacterium]|nr:hypothetical protein [Verrucomicrobiae bacterium]
MINSVLQHLRLSGLSPGRAITLPANYGLSSPPQPAARTLSIWPMRTWENPAMALVPKLVDFAAAPMRLFVVTPPTYRQVPAPITGSVSAPNTGSAVVPSSDLGSVSGLVTTLWQAEGKGLSGNWLG